jgi:hypothetical protein
MGLLSAGRSAIAIVRHCREIAEATQSRSVGEIFAGVGGRQAVHMQRPEKNIEENGASVADKKLSTMAKNGVFVGF